MEGGSPWSVNGTKIVPFCAGLEPDDGTDWEMPDPCPVEGDAEYGSGRASNTTPSTLRNLSAEDEATKPVP